MISLKTPINNQNFTNFTLSDLKPFKNNPSEQSKSTKKKISIILNIDADPDEA